MDLKTGHLFWPRQKHNPPRRQSLRKDLSCDVAIIGAGLGGAMIAHALSQAGFEVVLMDKRAIGEGSTSASTALVLYEIDTPLNELIRNRGKAAAVRSYRRCWESISELKKLVHDLGDKCQFRRRPSLYLASRPCDLAALKKEFQVRKQCGFRVEYLAPAQLQKTYSFTAPGAIYSPDAAEINPLQLACCLICAARHRGAQVFTQTEAVKSIEQRNGVTIRTTNGFKVNTRWLVSACGFETHEKAVQRVVKLKSSYAMVTRPVQRFTGWHERCLIWETRRPYFYARTTADNRLMIGGADEDFVNPTKRDQFIQQKTRVLQRKLEQWFPEIPIAPAYWWAGTFGETKDGLPYIGPIKKNSRILYALSYGANGTNFAVIAANIIRDLVLNKKNPEARLFAFDR